MKKALMFFAVAGICLLASCSHNAAMLGAGTAFSFGSGEFSLRYTDGLFLNSVNRENVKLSADLDSTIGVTYDPTSNTYKGIKSITYEVGPQMNGYAVELGEKAPDALKSYYDSLAKYYEYQAAQTALPAQQKSAISDEKSKAASDSVTEVLKKALEKAKSIIGKKEEDDGAEAVFQCDGDCEYVDLAGNDDIAYQLSIAMKLLAYDGSSHSMEETGESYKTTLEHFVSENVAFQGKGHTTTPLRVKAVTVKDGVVEKLSYVMRGEDGKDFDVECPSCVAMPE